MTSTKNPKVTTDSTERPVRHMDWLESRVQELDKKLNATTTSDEDTEPTSDNQIYKATFFSGKKRTTSSKD